MYFLYRVKSQLEKNKTNRAQKFSMYYVLLLVKSPLKAQSNKDQSTIHLVNKGLYLSILKI